MGSSLFQFRPPGEQYGVVTFLKAINRNNLKLKKKQHQKKKQKSLKYKHNNTCTCILRESDCFRQDFIYLVKIFCI